jgi:hypothetical protein
MILKLSVFISFLLLTINIVSQPLTISGSAFSPNEKLSYITSYNIKGIITELAGINMEIINVPGKKRPIYRLKFTTNTLVSWDNYVKIRHAYQTYIDAASTKPLIMAQNSDIKGNITKAKYTFKYKSKIVNIDVTKANSQHINKNLPINNNTYDIVSIMYKVRNLNYESFSSGKKIPYNIVFLERIINFNIKYYGKEQIKSDIYGNIECYKIGIVLDKKFIVEPNVTFAWLTADRNRVPVLISTIYKEGKALIKLNKQENLKY